MNTVGIVSLKIKFCTVGKVDIVICIVITFGKLHANFAANSNINKSRIAMVYQQWPKVHLIQSEINCSHRKVPCREEKWEKICSALQIKCNTLIQFQHHHHCEMSAVLLTTLAASKLYLLLLIHHVQIVCLHASSFSIVCCRYGDMELGRHWSHFLAIRMKPERFGQLAAANLLRYLP